MPYVLLSGHKNDTSSQKVTLLQHKTAAVNHAGFDIQTGFGSERLQRKNKSERVKQLKDELKNKSVAFSSCLTLDHIKPSNCTVCVSVQSRLSLALSVCVCVCVCTETEETKPSSHTFLTFLHTSTLSVSINVCVYVCWTLSPSPPADGAPLWLPW